MSCLSWPLLSWVAPPGPTMLWGSPGHQKGQTWVFEVTGGINYGTRSSHLHKAVTPKPAWTAEPQQEKVCRGWCHHTPGDSVGHGCDGTKPPLPNDQDSLIM